MSGWQAVTFHTTDPGYSEVVKGVIKSAAALNVPLRVYSYPVSGTWRGNLNHKSECILRAFAEFPDKDIVFVDADAIFRQWPVLFDTLSEKHGHDISAHFYRYSPQSGDNEELLSGTLWFQNNDMGRLLVKHWHAVGLRRPDVRHQMCLKIAIADLLAKGHKVRIFRHPAAYTCIFDYSRMKQQGAPVIEHFQVSRRLRKVVGYGQSLLSRGVAPKLRQGPLTPEQRRMLRRGANIMQDHLTSLGQGQGGGAK